jgi:hypothetical protein
MGFSAILFGKVKAYFQETSAKGTAVQILMQHGCNIANIIIITIL